MQLPEHHGDHPDHDDEVGRSRTPWRDPAGARRPRRVRGSVGCRCRAAAIVRCDAPAQLLGRGAEAAPSRAVSG
jgi:hypothetical protein